MDEERQRKLDEAFEKSTLMHRIFLEQSVPNEPTLMERFMASMKFTENWARGTKWVIRLVMTLPVLWAVVAIVREIVG